MITKFKDTKVAVHFEERRVQQYIHRYGSNGVAYYHNVVWEDEFEIVDFHTSRSSVYISIRSTNTRFLYYMRWWSMKDLLKNGTLTKGKFKGYFSFKHAWVYTTVVMFDPKHLPKRLTEELLAGPNWWEYAEPWNDRD